MAGEKNKAPVQTVRRKGGLISFGADVRKLIGPVLGKNGFMHADILSHWEDILGTILAKGIYPIKLTFPKGQRENATLHVKAVSGAFAMEFTARHSEILEKINGYFGYRAVSDIRVTQGALPVSRPQRKKVLPTVTPQKKSEVEETVSSIQDENLRQAAEELGYLLT